jgi:mannose-1-phosphate guanylyltransferase/mannose-1-phosphate guanylyltransferase/phosphomannomutase
LVHSYEDPILGTAGAARKLGWFLDTTFVLVYGDVLTDIDLSSLIAFHRSHSVEMTMVVYRVEDPTRAGIVDIDASGRVVSFVEKPRVPTSDLANAGIYIVEPSVLDLIPDGFADFGFDVIPRLISVNRPIAAWPIRPDDYLLDIGSIERYEQACRDAQNGRISMLRLYD